MVTKKRWNKIFFKDFQILILAKKRDGKKKKKEKKEERT